MAFFETEFPRKLFYGTRGGRCWFTTTNKGFSGWRQDNRNWKYPLGRWTITIKSQENADTSTLTDYGLFYAFFQNVFGKADGFRFYAPGDHTGSNEFIGLGDGGTTVFQLQKAYTIAGRSLTLPITKPVTNLASDYLGNPLANTVVIRVAGVTTTASVDGATGLITFASAPAGGAVITSDFEFDFPVHFEEDDWNGTVMESWVSGKKSLWNMASMKIEEVRIKSS